MRVIRTVYFTHCKHWGHRNLLQIMEIINYNLNSREGWIFGILKYMLYRVINIHTFNHKNSNTSKKSYSKDGSIISPKKDISSISKHSSNSLPCYLCLCSYPFGGLRTPLLGNANESTSPCTSCQVNQSIESWYPGVIFQVSSRFRNPWLQYDRSRCNFCQNYPACWLLRWNPSCCGPPTFLRTQSLPSHHCTCSVSYRIESSVWNREPLH